MSFFSTIKKSIIRAYYGFKVYRKAAAIGSRPKINQNTIVNKKTYLGDNFNSNGLIIIGKGKVIIGNNFHCGFGCNIITENHRFKNAEAIPYDTEYDIRDTFIEDNVWLGINVTILPGITIGEGAIIQAGSVVTKNIESLAIVGGAPANQFSKRNSFHYFKLKSEKLFH